MKKILITMREGCNNECSTDIIDKRLISFVEKCNFLPVVAPNNLFLIKELIKIKLDGVILSGGDNILSLGGSEIRDSVENEIIKHSIKNQIPVIGICRGMQKIQDFFGDTLEPTPNNVSETQEILINNDKHIVNSFHDYGTYKDSNNFTTWAKGNDGVIKAIYHNQYKFLGIMWHPERINPFRENDINYFVNFFK